MASTLVPAVETLVILVTAAVLSAAAVWWRMSRPGAARERAARLVGFGPGADEPADAFVFGPAEIAAPEEDRPARTTSITRLAVTIVVSTLVLVATVWAIGLLVKLQLDRYFLPGR